MSDPERLRRREIRRSPGAIERTVESKDYQEGVRAFLEKRPRLFTGR